MPRPTNLATLKCHLCKKKFQRIWWLRKKNLQRKTKNVFCSKECKNKYQTLGNGPNWKGGRRYLRGYVELRVSPEIRKSRRIFEHRLVMEKHLGRRLTSREFIHHKNGIKDDNRLENLEIVNLNSHRGKVTCPYCQKGFCIR